MAGYHIRKIKKGKYGEFSKVKEEWEELLDAREQNNPVMELCEITDILGAISSYTEKRYNLSLDELVTMTKATKRAFDSGHRKSKTTR
jgi:hypothetical protein